MWLFFISYVLRWFVLALILSGWLLFGGVGIFAGFKENGGQLSLAVFNVLWIGPLLFLVLCFVWAKLAYRFYRYELTENGFRKESGVIYKRYVTIPYDRIQNVDIYRGILARVLGLSDLQIQTAGASAVMGRYGAAGIAAEGRLPGLLREVAEQLRDELIARARQSKPQGL